MARSETVQTLHEVEAVRRSTRELLDAAWFPFLVWGVIVLGSAPFTQIGDGEPAIGIYWVAAAPAGLAISFWFFRSRELALGLVARNAPVYPAIAVAVAAGAFVLGAAGDGGMLSAVGPLYVVAAGLLGFAVLARSPLTATAAVAIAAVATVVLLVEPTEPAFVAALGQGAVAIIAGLVALARRRPPRLGGALNRPAARP
jgi:hypothetical protein